MLLYNRTKFMIEQIVVRFGIEMKDQSSKQTLKKQQKNYCLEYKYFINTFVVNFASNFYRLKR